jgi:UDP-N-acetylmuramate: L-alanyl-gamma-D-glutamyl-meso-diaminopimelate ligase
MHAGRDPSLLVGGVPLNFNEGFRLGSGEHFVLEGDEYDTAYFDKGPKFLHYRPRTAIFTGAEFDHADIYRDTAHYESAFEKFFALLPQDGYAAACSGFPNWKRLASFAKCKVESYCARDDAEADWHSRWLNLGPAGASFEIDYKGSAEIRVTLPSAGRHNVENALGVYAACRALGLKPDEIAAGFRSIKGVKRRPELRGEIKGVAVIDDFAHHPTAVRETIAAVRQRYAGRPVVAVFEPRSYTAQRREFQDAYRDAFAQADSVVLAGLFHPERYTRETALDPDQLVEAWRAAGKEAWYIPSPDDIVSHLAPRLTHDEVVLVMSNGGFGGIHGKLLGALRGDG